MRAAFAGAALALILATGCGTTTREGGCKDYEPSCLNHNYRKECVTTPDGCLQCTCVPREEPSPREPPR